MGGSIGKFILNDPKRVYSPGNMVTGKIVMTSAPRNNLKDIILTFGGTAVLKRVPGLQSDRRRSTPRTYISLIDGRQGTLSNLKEGDEIPFSIMVPLDAPSTFHSICGGLAYHLEVTFEYPFPYINGYGESDEVIVLRPLDLSVHPELKLPIVKTTSKTFCYLCCASSSLTIVARLPKTAFAKGETIQIVLEINNASNINVHQVYINLSEEILWYMCTSMAERGKKSVLNSMNFPGVAPGSSRTWNKRIEIPSKSFPNMDYNQTCSLIEIIHELSIVAEVPGMHLSLKLRIPIRISDVVLNG